ncbi:MAG: YcxB family protein [Pseudomonadota bacterium]
MEPVKYTLTEQDQLAFNILHWQASVPKAIFYAGLAIFGMGVLAYLIDGAGTVIFVAVGGLLGAVLVLCLARYVLVPRFAKRSWREFALIKETVELAISIDGFSMTQPSAYVDSKWEQMIAWDENSHIFAIYVTQQQAYILPKSQVSEHHLSYARDRLIESGLIAKGTKRK